MLPDAVTDLGSQEYSEPGWQKAKSLIDKATKTGLGAELIALRKSYDGAKDTLKKIDVKMVGKLRDEDAIKAAKVEAQKVLSGSVVQGLITHLDTAAKKATTVSKLKLSKGAVKASTAMAAAFRAAKKALEDETLADFDAQLQHMNLLYAAQRKDFKPSAQKLIDTLKKLEDNPVAETAEGTEFSGAFRGFQNKIGNLPEFKDIYDDKFDGLFTERMDLKKMTPEEIKKEMLKIVSETRAYMKVCLVRAKAKGY